MATETNKRKPEREREGWFQKYLVGKGVDIGCGDDPVTPDCDRWDLPQGDAQLMQGVEDEKYDWVYSSHCLEHMKDPKVALSNWWRVLRKGGILVVMVPDEDLYEQGHWPPFYNMDHKTTWTIRKNGSWSPVSHNLYDELEALPGAEIMSMKLHSSGYDYSLHGMYKVDLHISNMDLAQEIEKNRALTPEAMAKFPTVMKHLGFFPVDQTGSPMNAEVSIEGIARKRAA